MYCNSFPIAYHCFPKINMGIFGSSRDATSGTFSPVPLAKALLRWDDWLQGFFRARFRDVRNTMIITILCNSEIIRLISTNDNNNSLWRNEDWHIFVFFWYLFEEACFHPAIVLALFWLCSPRLAKRSMLLCRMQMMMGWLFFLVFHGFSYKLVWWSKISANLTWNSENIYNIWDVWDIYLWVFFVQSRISWKLLHNVHVPRTLSSRLPRHEEWPLARVGNWNGANDAIRKYFKIIHLLIMNISKVYDTTNTILIRCTSSPQKNMKIPIFILKSFFSTDLAGCWNLTQHFVGSCIQDTGPLTTGGDVGDPWPHVLHRALRFEVTQCHFWKCLFFKTCNRKCLQKSFEMSSCLSQRLKRHVWFFRWSRSVPSNIHDSYKTKWCLTFSTSSATFKFVA